MATQQTPKGDPLHDCTAFQRDLLFLLSNTDEAEPHGLHLKEQLERFYEGEIHHGRLYPNLDTLEERGLVQKGTIDKRTNSYKLTRRGRQELEAHRAFIDGDF
jgi:DNA-binding PadR family transcriptional regulator